MTRVATGGENDLHTFNHDVMEAEFDRVNDEYHTIPPTSSAVITTAPVTSAFETANETNQTLLRGNLADER